MPANTAHGYPYPLGTDRVADGDDSIHALATAVDTQLGVAASGSATTPVPSAVNTAANVTVTFPASRFTAPPNVALSIESGGPWNVSASVQFVTATGMTITGARSAGALAVIIVRWIAHQI